MGNNNLSRIVDNWFIGYNKLAGVKGDCYAWITVVKNLISKNLGQGILLVETSCGHIEKNKLTHNIKANIAFGGSKSVDTVIINNQIEYGRSEGIYLIDAGQGIYLYLYLYLYYLY